MIMSSFALMQRARAITDCLRGNAPVGTSQSTSDGYELICFTAKSSRNHSLLKRDQADGNKPTAPVMAMSLFALMQRARAIIGSSKGIEPMGTTQSSSDGYGLISLAAKSLSHHCLLEREHADGNEPEQQ
jgi:hypothetical protein